MTAGGDQPRAGSRLRAALFGVLGVLLLANVFNLGRNAESRPHRTNPKSMYAIARDSPYWSVRGTFAVYDYLRHHLAGKRLTLPPHLRQHTWYLERQARLQVTTVDQPIELPGRSFRVLRARAERAFHLRTDKRNDELYILLDRDADAYVIARYQGENALLLLPDQLYERVTAAR